MRPLERSGGGRAWGAAVLCLSLLLGNGREATIAVITGPAC